MILALLSFFFVYEVCFFVGLIFALISGVASGVLGGHHDVGHGGDVGHEGGTEGSGADAGGAEAATPEATGGHMPDFAPISPVTIFTFITCFGGGGMILSRIDATSSPLLHLPLSLIAGFAGAGIVFSIFHKIFAMTQSSSEARVAGLIGHSATVVTPIPENGMGEIVYVVGGTRYNAPAREESGQAVVSGAEVKITRAVGGNFHVKKV